MPPVFLCPESRIRGAAPADAEQKLPESTASDPEFFAGPGNSDRTGGRPDGGSETMPVAK